MRDMEVKKLQLKLKHCEYLKEKFQDLNFFTQFTVSKDLGTIVWGNEIDISPETLYEKCEQNHCT
jgi:hypothetical protein